MSQFKVMVVDDDPIITALMVSVLEAEFQPTSLNNGADALSAIVRDKPDVILLDIDMPGMDGYEVCRRLKENEETAGIPVIFVSAHDTLEERLNAYDSGGEDFIIKPFEPDEMMKKVHVAIKYRAEREQLKEEKAQAMLMAMSVMTNLGETGVVLGFLRNCFSCASYANLARLAIDTMQQYELECQIQIRTRRETLTFTRNGAASGLEASVFEKMLGMGRVFQFKTRMIVNFERVSLLIVNMPQENEELAGRIRDNAALVAEGAEASANAIALNEEIKEKSELLSNATRKTREAVDVLKEQYLGQKLEAQMVLARLEEDVEKVFYRLGLSESQEEVMRETVRAAAQRAIRLYEKGIDLDSHLGAILHELEIAG
jgi:DNA-binding response OmpR family regulator